MTDQAQPAPAAQPKEDTLPEILYHYTTLEGFKGIIESGELRATNAGNVNDYNEIEYGIAQFNKYADPNFSRSKNEVKSAIQAIKRNIFIASFSFDNDEYGSPPHWVMYGGKAEGIRIGMHTTDIHNFINNFNLSHGLTLGESQYRQNVGKVRYTEDDQRDLYNFLIQYIGAKPKLSYADKKAWLAMAFLPYCKSRYFEFEKEYRVAMWLPGELTDRIAFTTAKSNKRYITIPIRTPTMPSLPIAEIMAGPCMKKTGRCSLSSFVLQMRQLNKIQFSDEIKDSKVTYR